MSGLLCPKELYIYAYKPRHISLFINLVLHNKISRKYSGKENVKQRDTKL